MNVVVGLRDRHNTTGFRRNYRQSLCHPGAWELQVPAPFVGMASQTRRYQEVDQEVDLCVSRGATLQLNLEHSCPSRLGAIISKRQATHAPRVGPVESNPGSLLSSTLDQSDLCTLPHTHPSQRRQITILASSKFLSNSPTALHVVKHKKFFHEVNFAGGKHSNEIHY